MSNRTGAATGMIYGLALGYKSVIVPVVTLAAIVYGAHANAGMYGIALAALGMLATLATCLTIDVYGPVRVVRPSPRPHAARLAATMRRAALSARGGRRCARRRLAGVRQRGRHRRDVRAAPVGA